jgi:ATP-dependent DNA helicase DinG
MSERVVISTNTISLQEQLISKDIPFLQQFLPHNFKVVLVKGRSNYLCLRRLEAILTYETDLFETESEEDEMIKIHQWAAETNDGSRSDMNPQPKSSVWSMVCSERDTCLGQMKCPYASECFYQKARNAMYRANILVVNHHLLFSDLALRSENSRFSVLPGYKYVIIDEAQNMENAATEHIGISISKFAVRYLLDSLCSRDRKRGLFATLGLSTLGELVDSARSKNDIFFSILEKWYDDNRSGTKRIKDRDLVPNMLDEPILSLKLALEDILPNAKTEEIEKDITAYTDRCARLRDELQILLDQSLENSVYWLEVSRGRITNISLNAAPVNVSEVLQPNLFGCMESVIMTSATLSTNQNFDYFKRRIGLHQCREMILGSPFDYKKQAKLYLSVNMPDPRNNGMFVPAAVERIKRCIEITQGKAFILFTSYRMMNEVYENMRSWFEEQEINVFRQGSGMSRYTMLQEFKSDIDSVIFGTSSFWEGVDVKGEALSCVIVVKLPFSVPTHPVVEARIEDIQAKGGDPFMEYNLPEAIIRLKQGFGRLIRTKTDVGIVAILDPRIKTKFYGRWFLDSLPECEVIVE